VESRHNLTRHVRRPSRRFAQATTYLASTAKSNASDQAYWAALSDVLEHGSLPVPNHLRNAGDRRMKHHGIGVGYMYPHDFEGHDVNQQYLPDKLHEMGRRYYVPSDQGSERGIGDLLQTRREARAAGRPKHRSPTGPAVDAMRVGNQATRTREGARKDLAETEKRDAEAGPSSSPA
jgi:hypothetical protein